MPDAPTPRSHEALQMTGRGSVWIAERTDVHTATLMIHADNLASLGVAARAGFLAVSAEAPNVYLKRPVREPAS